MSDSTSVLVVLSDEETRNFAQQVTAALGYTFAEEVVGTPRDAATHLQQTGFVPRFIILDIGTRTQDVLPEIDELAGFCSPDVRVVAVGKTNDIQLYRELINRGVLEYYPLPADVNAVKQTLIAASEQDSSATSKVITFMSAASGDGSSTIALNTAYCLGKYYGKSTVVIDMDFQFGMIARNLDLTTQFGIKELFEHSERTIDTTLIDRMLADYDDTIKVMAAPSDLRLWPSISPEVIRELLLTLRQRFDCIVIDLPHIWSPWLASALTSADYNVLVAQLWLRSVTHTSRLLSAWRDLGIPEEQIIAVVNRSGAKFKEAVSAKDYENVCRKRIDFYIPNDIKSIVAAENEGKTIPEVSNTALTRELKQFAGQFTDEIAADNNDNKAPAKGGVFNRK